MTTQKRLCSRLPFRVLKLKMTAARVVKNSVRNNMLYYN